MTGRPFCESGSTAMDLRRPSTALRAAGGNWFIEVNKSLNLGFSLGLVVSTRDKGNVTEVVWDSPVFRAGLTTASKLIAVNGQEFAPEVLVEAIRAAKGTNKPIELLVKTFDRYKTVSVPYFEGLRYP